MYNLTILLSFHEIHFLKPVRPTLILAGFIPIDALTNGEVKPERERSDIDENVSAGSRIIGGAIGGAVLISLIAAAVAITVWKR